MDRNDEYINLSLPDLRMTEAKYVAFSCNAYHSKALSPNLTVGWMDSEHPMKISENGVAVSLLENSLGNNHPQVALCYNNIAGVLRKQKNYEDALKYYQIALEIYESTYGENHPGVGIIKSNTEKVKAKMKEQD